MGELQLQTPQQPWQQQAQQKQKVFGFFGFRHRHLASRFPGLGPTQGSWPVNVRAKSLRPHQRNQKEAGEINKKTTGPGTGLGHSNTPAGTESPPSFLQNAGLHLHNGRLGATHSLPRIVVFRHFNFDEAAERRHGLEDLFADTVNLTL